MKIWADNAETLDIVSAYYRYDKDADGNPVEQYSLANRVQEREWEHGNGMTYNRRTNEIYVSLYTNTIEENRGCLYVMDPDTLGYKRTIKVADDYNILGIDYIEKTDQYIIQTNVDGGYSFKILDRNFQVIDDLGEFKDSTVGTNFQDCIVSEDYIITFPLTLDMGIGDYFSIYSIEGRCLVNETVWISVWRKAYQMSRNLCVKSEPGNFWRSSIFIREMQIMSPVFINKSALLPLYHGGK